MKIITYKCNLCQDIIQKENIYKYYWKSDIIPQQYILLSWNALEECDKHICKQCIINIQRSNIKL